MTRHCDPTVGFIVEGSRVDLDQKTVSCFVSGSQTEVWLEEAAGKSIVAIARGERCTMVGRPVSLFRPPIELLLISQSAQTHSDACVYQGTDTGPVSRCREFRQSKVYIAFLAFR